MLKTTLPLLVLATLAALQTETLGQDFNAMNAAFNQQLNAQMQMMTNNIVYSNMQNPYVQQQYQIYRQQGGQLDFPNYCFRYAETGGMTPEGTRRAMQTSNQIHQQDMINYQAYVDHSRALSQLTYDWRNNIQDRWARQRGENLTARSTYIDQSSGSLWQLPNNAYAGQVFVDQRSGTAFQMDGQGQYWMNNGSGWQPLHLKR